jgi:hypothetical protein
MGTGVRGRTLVRLGHPGLVEASERSREGRTFTTREGSSGHRLRKPLALDAHTLHYRRHASPSIRHSIDDDETVEADAHPTVVPPRLPRPSASRDGTAPRDQYRRDGLTEISLRRTAIDDNGDFLTPTDPIARQEGQAPSRHSTHRAILPRATREASGSRP